MVSAIASCASAVFIDLSPCTDHKITVFDAIKQILILYDRNLKGRNGVTAGFRRDLGAVGNRFYVSAAGLMTKNGGLRSFHVGRNALISFRALRTLLKPKLS